jgi:Fumble.
LARKFLRDEGMNCQVLKAIIENAGGEASKDTGDFVQKVEALPDIEEKMDLLIKGQEWVAKQIRKNRKTLMNTSEAMFLEAMKIQHEENVDALKEIVEKEMNGEKEKS